MSSGGQLSQETSSGNGSYSSCLSVRDILSHKSKMFNYKLPSDRAMHDSSLIYCNLCDYSCDLTDKSAIICHYLSTHPDDNIVYSYLWPQMEQTPSNTFKIKYYLIKANLKIRNKDANNLKNLDLSQIAYPTSLLIDDNNDQINDTDQEVSLIMDKMLNWLEKNLIPQNAESTVDTPLQQQEDVQELEEEQDVQEVEISGEDPYEAGINLQPHSPSSSSSSSSTSLDELIKLSSSASFYFNQQRLTAGSSSTHSQLLDNQYLVHLLAINKSENAFRIKQIHDYYGGCFLCGKQVEFNMKHYQSHFTNEISCLLCLHCNYKEYKCECNETTLKKDLKMSSTPAPATAPSQSNIDLLLYNDNVTDISAEEKSLQSHLSTVHNMDFQQILQQHQKLQQSSNMIDSSSGGFVIEATPMNDMYLSINIKVIKYVEDDLLKKDEFRADLVYNCPICCGDAPFFNNAHLCHEPLITEQYSQVENISFDYLVNHFLAHHQLKTIPLFICMQCNCVRVSLIDCLYHHVRSHFNKKVTIGLCAYNIYDKVQHQVNQHLPHHKSSSKANAHAQATSLTVSQLPVPSNFNLYGSAGPLVYCISCNEHFSNEHSFIRHSFLYHLFDPNVNLNWYKVYSSSLDLTLQQIVTAFNSADNSPDQSSDQIKLSYECPVCLKSLDTKDSIQRHLLYHGVNENYEYEITCQVCNKQLSPSVNLAECLLHAREFRGHRLTINYHKYVISSNENSTPVPMVSCVLCGHESNNLLSCISHIMLDHFGYDSNTVKIKRFVNYMMSKLGHVQNSPEFGSKTKSLNKQLTVKQQLKLDQNVNQELSAYFSNFNLLNEIVTCLLNAANASDAKNSTNLSLYKPDIFFNDIKCFKCNKFSTKYKLSLFTHLNKEHHFDLKEIEKQYESCIQRQLQHVDELQLVQSFERQRKDVIVQQTVILKEAKLKNDSKQPGVLLISQQHNHHHNHGDDAFILTTQPSSNNLNNTSNQVSLGQQQNVNNELHSQGAANSSSQNDKIQSTIDQVLLDICHSKADYQTQSGSLLITEKQEPMVIDNNNQIISQQQQQHITVTAQPPEAENLFVFKCNLCEPYTTDDATQLLEHYKVNYLLRIL